MDDRNLVMPHAVILSAGRGGRLTPLTDQRPKCLVPVAGRQILEWQLLALAAAGVREASVVTGFGAEQVEAAVKLMDVPLAVTCRFNPFHAVADNIASVWTVRDLLGDGTLLMNGDTLVDPALVKRVRELARAPVTVTIDRKEHYDADDMKVRLDEDRLARIGKDLDAEIDGESIGLLAFRGDGGERFATALDELLREPGAHDRWYLAVVDRLAAAGAVDVVSIAGLPWAEIDFPHDLPIAERRLQTFRWEDGGGATPTVARATHRSVGAMGGTKR